MKPIIRVENLSKRYAVGVQSKPYGTLRDSLVGVARAPLKAFKRSGGNGTEKSSFWALKDVSFEIQPGEVVGIIGRNGAGKSTLLKILSRITEPTHGKVELYGRIGSLLEVGTGFHPELTGRENVFLNGAILGMRREEIANKFDEIVDFAEVEAFLDTPVKHYSSGMYTRLAFAVAANLEPEVLIVDEVLAVGDAEFQRKCLGKMKSVSTNEGRTVLFVSHNIAAVENLCQKVLLLNKGQLVFLGRTEEALKRYINSAIQFVSGEVELTDHPSRRSHHLPILQSVRLLDAEHNVKSSFNSGESMLIELTFKAESAINNPQFGVAVDDSLGYRVFSIATYLSNTEAVSKPISSGRAVCLIKDLALAPGRYNLSISAGTTHNPTLDDLLNAAAFDVEAGDYYGNGRMPDASWGKLLVRSQWRVHEN